MISIIKNWITSNSKVIIICLLVLLMLKSCSTCTSKRQYEYKTVKYEYIIDSLENNIENNSIEYNNIIHQMNDTIYILRSQNKILFDAINDIKIDRDYYRKVNNDLVNVTNNLSIKKDTIN